MYENVLTLEPNGRRRATPEMLRRVAYLAIQNGACGYTYGAQGMWHLQWDEPKENEPSLGFGSFDPWYRAIDFPGAQQMSIMKDFYEAVGWGNLKPVDPNSISVAGNGAFVLTFDSDDMNALFMPSVTADENMSTIVAYYSETNRYSIQFRTLVHLLYKAQWFDPATGTYSLIDGSIKPENGIWSAPAKSTESDAILLITAQTEK